MAGPATTRIRLTEVSSGLSLPEHDDACSSGVRRSAGAGFPTLGQSIADALFAARDGALGVYGVAGSYIAARLAPERPRRNSHTWRER
jgi:hypothetical protein